MLATAPVPRVAICQMPMKARNSAIDTIAARKRSEEVIWHATLFPGAATRTRVMRCRTGTHGVCGGPGCNECTAAHCVLRAASRPGRRCNWPSAHDAFLILKLAEIILRLGRIEGLAHHRKTLGGGGRRRQPGLLHQPGGVGGEIDLRGDAGIVDVALDLTPALHLRHDPDRKGLPRERIEIDAVRLRHDIAETVGEGAGEDLLQHDLRLVQVIRRRDGFGDLLAVLGLVRERGGLDDRFEQRAIGVRHRGDELLRCGEGAARMPFPDILGQDVDEADAVIDRALVHRIGAEEAVDVVGAQIGDHFRRRHGADLHVGIGIDAVLGEIIAQQIIVHRDSRTERRT